jgi:cobalt/nickel transport system permease protein
MLSGLGALDALSSADTPVHRLDPRAKLVTTTLFVVAVASAGRYEVLGLLPLAAYPLLLCLVGRVPLGYLATRLLIAAPFALIIGAFNPVFDTGTRMVVAGVGISGGWISYLSIITRFALTVAAAIALVAVTGFNAVCTSLERLGAPRVFVVQLMFLYRYLFLLTAETGRMLRAKRLRTFERRGTPLGLFGSMAGHLLLRTLDRAERIQKAMSCRGFAGEIPLIRPLRFRAADAGFLLGWALFFAAVRLFDLPDLLGRLALGAWA